MTKDNTFLYFIGTAGSGKSRLTGSMKTWYTQHGLDAITVNLDPGAEKLPYEPDIDVREWIRISEVMEEYGLGPNGAQIACADMVAFNLNEIKERLEEYKADAVLVDTPGQLELFVFRESGKFIVESLNPERSLVAYLMDPFLARTASGFVSQMMLSATTRFRLMLPMANILSKSDLLKESELGTILNWSAEPDLLCDAVMDEEPSMQREFSIDTARLLSEIGAQSRLITASAETMKGLEDIYVHLQNQFAGGEDVRSD